MGNVALRQWANTPPVYEPCLGVVDPACKGHGLFSRIFARAMERAREIPMQYLFFDFVTNHDISQKLVAKYGVIDMALFVGCQSAETQAKLERLGMGPDPKASDRYSLLVSIIPQVEHPFGEEIELPENLGEMLAFLLDGLRVRWIPASRFSQLPAEGSFETKLQPAQKAVIFDMAVPGRQAVARVLAAWRELMRGGYAYAAVEAPVGSAGMAMLYDLLAEAGFFVSGFVPYRFSDRLGLRLQSVGPTRLAFDEIRVFTPTARRLLDVVRESFERNAKV